MADRLICGLHPVGRMLERSPDRVLEVFLQDGLGQQRQARLPVIDTDRIPVRRQDAASLERLAGTPKHQGVVARIRAAEPLNEATALDFVTSLAAPLILVLDGIEDPRNFGACLRSADAAGVDLVVAGRSRNVGLTPIVSKAAAGAAEMQALALVGNLARFLARLADAGVYIVGTAGEAETSLFSADLAGSLALVVGAEGSGLRRLTRDRCDLLVNLPMRGTVESLNVSVAAGVCLFEAVRQRSKPLAPAQDVR